MVPVVSVIGKSNSGKTTLLEKLIPELSGRGYRVGTIKHDAHRFDIDVEGKDSWRHAHAGAKAVAISSPEKVAIVRRVDTEQTLDDLVAMMDGIVDIVLTEGYKSAGKPRIEVCRKERSDNLICDWHELIAVVTDIDFEVDIPKFGLNDVKDIADLIEHNFLKSDAGELVLEDGVTT